MQEMLSNAALEHSLQMIPAAAWPSYHCLQLPAYQEQPTVQTHMSTLWQRNASTGLLQQQGDLQPALKPSTSMCSVNAASSKPCNSQQGSPATQDSTNQEWRDQAAQHQHAKQTRPGRASSDKNSAGVLHHLAAASLRKGHQHSSTRGSSSSSSSSSKKEALKKLLLEALLRQQPQDTPRQVPDSLLQQLLLQQSPPGPQQQAHPQQLLQQLQPATQGFHLPAGNLRSVHGSRVIPAATAAVEHQAVAAPAAIASAFVGGGVQGLLGCGTGTIQAVEQVLAAVAAEVSAVLARQLQEKLVAELKAVAQQAVSAGRTFSIEAELQRLLPQLKEAAATAYRLKKAANAAAMAAGAGCAAGPCGRPGATAVLNTTQGMAGHQAVFRSPGATTLPAPLASSSGLLATSQQVLPGNAQEHELMSLLETALISAAHPSSLPSASGLTGQQATSLSHQQQPGQQLPYQHLQASSSSEGDVESCLVQLLLNGVTDVGGTPTAGQTATAAACSAQPAASACVSGLSPGASEGGALRVMGPGWSTANSSGLSSLQADQMLLQQLLQTMLEQQL